MKSMGAGQGLGHRALIQFLSCLCEIRGDSGEGQPAMPSVEPGRAEHSLGRALTCL